MPDLESLSSPISVSSSDSDRFDNLVRALRLSTLKTEVTGTSSSEVDIMRFRNLKRAMLVATPSPKAILPTTHALLPVTSPSVEVTVAVTRANLGFPRTSVLGKCKGKEPLVDLPKRPQREMSSVGATELWKPNFFTCELGRLVTEESWDTIRNLLAMQHVQMSIMASVLHGSYVEYLALPCIFDLHSLQRVIATSDRMAEYSAKLKWAKKKMETNANKAKLALADVNQLKADLVFIEQARDASYPAIVQAQGKATIVEATLVELSWQHVDLCTSGFLLGGSIGQGTTTHGPRLPLLSSSLSLQCLILHLFYLASTRRSFLNRLEEDEVVPEPVPDLAVAPDIEATNLVEEVERMIDEVPGERSAEETGADDGGDAD
ncbi:hypothetical protein Acr_25g0000220 [Actinidia rufa]|uniref:Uncharacterized protein n=1 Tax=Actinidia rufa TaxID=165716 RepID=A0A7J0GXR5_9ERIC|nr:hypothetical protein Acr_25g0000220 [Actinidia rufa]